MMRATNNAGRHAGPRSLLGAVLLAAVALPLAVGGCGEKIAIPQPNSIWANLAYSIDDTLVVAGVRDLITNRGNLFILTAGELSKCNRAFEVDATVTLSGDPTTLCADDTGELILIWEQQTQTVRFFGSQRLDELGSAYLPDVQSCISMVTSDAGIDSTVAGGLTYLYLSDSVAGLVHRYTVLGLSGVAFDCVDCLERSGVLAWPTGAGARSVHRPGGLAVDSEGGLLVCEMDPERNWVLRFDSAPDPADATPILLGEDQTIEARAGTAIIFGAATCEPEPAPEDYVLGDAAACGETDWVGGASEEPGEFDRPYSVAVDGAGKIFVADQNNNRVQIFYAWGEHTSEFNVRSGSKLPSRVAVIDVRIDDGTDHFGAFAFVLTEGSSTIVKLISAEQYLTEHDELPPYEE